MPQRIILILILLFSVFISSCETFLYEPLYRGTQEEYCKNEKTPVQPPSRCEYPSYETYRQQREQTLNEEK